MNIRPLYDRIVVKRTTELENTTRSGIVIPDSAKEKPQEGEVVAIGRGTRLEAVVDCGASIVGSVGSIAATN